MFEPRSPPDERLKGTEDKGGGGSSSDPRFRRDIVEVGVLPGGKGGNTGWRGSKSSNPRLRRDDVEVGALPGGKVATKKCPKSTAARRPP